jgi:deoxycytidylate deaminase
MSKPGTSNNGAQDYVFDWSDFAFSSKKPLKELRSTFIAAPREISEARLKQIIKEYLPKGNLLLGISKEQYVLGLENQPQFKMLELTDHLRQLTSRINAASPKNKIYILQYSQRDTAYVFEKIDFARVVLVNGSWYTAFHMRPEFYAMTKKQTPYEMVSPFADEQEAREYPASLRLPALPARGQFTGEEMFDLVAQAAKRSYDFGGYQTAVAVGLKKGAKYELILTAHNQVLPYETYAMHYGASREKHFSPMNDLNHYDTIHAEMLSIVKAQKEKLDLKGATLFINLLPCPHCARALSLTDIAEFVYAQDHSAGYAVELFETLGKKVYRHVPPAKPAL